MILAIVAGLTSIVLSLLFGVPYIEFLKKKMYSQYIREEGPESHKIKSGTPTTGGMFIVLSVVISSIIALLMRQIVTTESLIILLTLLFFTLAGFMDDINKIKHKSNAGGLKAKSKLFLQIAISILPTLYITLSGQTQIILGPLSLDLGFLYPIFAIFLITGVSNAVNLTDGLDGLAASNLIISFLACTIICLYIGKVDIAIICSSILGACIGFLYFNKPKAKVFMGDTGSLALGGILGAISVIAKFEIWLILIGIIYLIETLSVILQVLSYKTFKRRIFKMSPIHHHFELSGWSEKKIDIVFTIVTLISCIIAVSLFIKYTMVG